MPALVVKNLSSLSVVGQPLSDEFAFTVGDKITGITKLNDKAAENRADTETISDKSQQGISTDEEQPADEYSKAAGNKDSTALSKSQPAISGVLGLLPMPAFPILMQRII